MFCAEKSRRLLYDHDSNGAIAKANREVISLDNPSNMNKGGLSMISIWLNLLDLLSSICSPIVFNLVRAQPSF